ncbi:ribonuclease E activity regulator RraA [Schauerella aestuarii]|uniref:ribonuclease E activity regulator RraA n=1 Tax=Schauerella aestuarii TaxID=2511204 RepID=UPI001369B79A|nr:ribonuclease E activity regulator RraA [Achromobacter aestuarii]MYZ44439.1 ribonuclease E inhibitor RraA [Achromobacter aestuarii]
MTQPFVPPSYALARDVMWATADLCDALRGVPDAGLRILPDGFHAYGGRPWYFGEVALAVVPQSNGAMSLAAILGTPGQGRVLIAEGRGNAQHAILGDRMAALAVQNGWAGVIVHGYVRDTKDLIRMPVGIHALGARPNRAEDMPPAEIASHVEIGAITVRAGDWVYADGDGIILLARRHTEFQLGSLGA